MGRARFWTSCVPARPRETSAGGAVVFTHEEGKTEVNQAARFGPSREIRINPGQRHRGFLGGPGAMGTVADSSQDRPRRRKRRERFDPRLEEIYRASGLVRQGQPRRNYRNALWAMRALGRLMDHGLSSFEWLYSSDRVHTMRKMVLSALGRIEDEEEMVAMARELCQRQPTTRDAVAMIR